MDHRFYNHRIFLLIALLSNDVYEWSIEWRKFHNLDKYFDTTVVSGDPDVKARKPTKEIYEKLLNQFEFPPESYLYVDDKSRNLKPAAELGIVTILMKRFSQVSQYKPHFIIEDLADLLDILKI